MLHSDFMNLKLEDLTPQGAEFTLKSTGKTYKLRPVNLLDEAWMSRTFGAKLQTIFIEGNMFEIMRIVYNQLEMPDKEQFRSQEVRIINEQGDEMMTKIGGADLLFSLVTGMEEKAKILEALVQTIGVSRPMIDKFKADEEKKSLSPSTGQKSSTFSAPNMDGQPNTL